MAGQARELFNGSIPPALLSQIMKAVDFTSWESVWVGCSGTFSFERAIGAAYPGKPIYGNDVSLISGVIASVATETPLEFQFVNKLAHWEPLLAGRPYLDRAAALILCMSLSGQYRGTNILRASIGHISRRISITAWSVPASGCSPWRARRA